MRTLNQITSLIIETSIAIHEKLGPGLLESVYQTVLPPGLERRGLLVEAHRSVPFEFEGMKFTQGLTLDLLVDQRVVVELKSIEKIAPVHSKQVLTYLRLLDLRVGLLLNFGCATMKEGIHRIVNNYTEGADAYPNAAKIGEADKEHHEQDSGGQTNFAVTQAQSHDAGNSSI